jgi:MFS family permease
MSVTAFHAGASEYGVLSSTMAIGSVTGALLAARRARPRMTLLLLAGTVFGVGCTTAALMPNYVLFGLVLVVIGVSTQTFTTSTNSLVQLTTEPAMRGRVIAILLAIALGGTPLGAPVVGWVADRFGPRWALGVGAASGFGAALVGLVYLIRYRGLRFYIEGKRLRYSIDDPRPASAAVVPESVTAMQRGGLDEAEEDTASSV